jgi:RNA recognition motif-containing protein
MVNYKNLMFTKQASLAPQKQALQGLQHQQPQNQPPPAAPFSCVFIGNIPYDTPLPHLSQTLSLIGPFSLFRLKLDRDTLAPKGFGFVEYRD